MHTDNSRQLHLCGIDINTPCGRCRYDHIENFSMQVLSCSMGDSLNGSCHAQLHLRVRFYLDVCFESNCRMHRCQTCFERCVTFSVHRGDIDCSNYALDGCLQQLRVYPTCSGYEAEICVQLYVFGDGSTCSCSDCKDDPPCNRSADTAISCGAATVFSDIWYLPDGSRYQRNTFDPLGRCCR